MLTKRPCRVCRRWFVPDRRVGRRQRACSATACQIARRARTQASWRRRNPDYFIAHRVQRRQLKADEAQGGVPPLVLPSPLSLLGHFGRVLLVAAQDQKAGQMIDSIGEPVRLPR